MHQLYFVHMIGFIYRFKFGIQMSIKLLLITLPSNKGWKFLNASHVSIRKLCNECELWSFRCQLSCGKKNV